MSTQKSYKKNVKKFVDFVHSFRKGFQPFPANHGLVFLFACHLFQLGLSPATITSTLSSIGFAHKLHGYEDPTSHFLVVKLMRALRKGRTTQDTRLPISFKILKSMVNSLKHLSLSFYLVQLYGAMFVLAFFGFLRSSEYCKSDHNLQFDDVSVTPSRVKITFRSYKHHKGPPTVISIPASDSTLCPTIILKSFLKFRGFQSGPLFCTPDLSPISYHTFSQVFNSAINVCNLKGRFAPHSFRIGAATHMAILGYPDHTIQKVGRWNSSAWMAYVRRNNVKVYM